MESNKPKIKRITPIIKYILFLGISEKFIHLTKLYLLIHSVYKILLLDKQNQYRHGY